jgi:hypothetical protein
MDGVPIDHRGATLFAALLGLALALPLTLVVLARYQRAVVRSMRQRIGPGEPDASGPHRSAPPERPLALRWIDPGAPDGAAGDSERLARALRGPRRAAVVYTAAGIAHACVITAIIFLGQGFTFQPVRFAAVALTLAWPVVPALFQVAARSPASRVGAVAVFFVMLLAVGGTPPLLLWAIYMAPPTAALVAVSNRRLRSAGPFVLLATSASVLAANYALVTGLGWWDRQMGAYTWAGLWIAAGLAAGVAGTWAFLAWVAARYRRKRSSDLEIVINQWWLLYTLWECALLASDLGARALAGLGAYLAYRIVTRAGFAWQARRRPAAPASLLFLRVFAGGRKNAQLVDDLGLSWRHVGPINLIAGPDLATAHLDPHEFLAFVSGRLSREFVRGPDDLRARLAALDRSPDPDGRYRVNEFFCHDDTWRAALARLAEPSDVVLMDLRGFTAESRGCVYELGHLVETVPLRRIVLLADAAAPTALSETLATAWSSVTSASPNHDDPAPALTVLRVGHGRRAPAHALVELLCRAAA